MLGATGVHVSAGTKVVLRPVTHPSPSFSHWCRKETDSSDPESAAVPSSWWLVTGKQDYRCILTRRSVRGVFLLSGAGAAPLDAQTRFLRFGSNFSEQAEKMEPTPPPLLSPALPFLETHSTTGEATHQRALPRHSCAQLT